MDRFGPYRVIAGLFVTGALFSVLLGLSLSWTAAALIAVSSFGSGFCTSGVQKGGNALCVYFYPTALRSTGLGWGLGIGRIGAIVGPLAVGYMLTAGWSSAAVFTATAIPMLLGRTCGNRDGPSLWRASGRRPTRLKSRPIRPPSKDKSLAWNRLPLSIPMR